MSRQECWNHNRDKKHSHGDDDEKIGIKADEDVKGEKRECMSWNCPVEQAYELVLKNKDDTNSRIKSSKVIGHQRKAEGWSTKVA